MRKSEKLSNEFMSIIDMLDLIDSKLGKMDVESATAREFQNKIQNLLEEFEEFMYETCAPLEMMEDEAEVEIRSLEKKIAELRASI